MKIKKGHTHLYYKQEHTVDMETEAIPSAEIHYGNASDGNTLLGSVNTAQGNLQQASIDEKHSPRESPLPETNQARYRQSEPLV